jgi:hypothetical protein
MQGKNRQPTERISPVGRPIWQDEKGVDYSEKTVTFPYKDKWVTFPSVDQNGNVLSEEEVEAYVLENGPVDPITGEVFPLFDSLEDATSFAQDRSKMLGGFNKGGLLDEDRQTQEAFDAVTGEAMALTPPRVEDQETGRVRQNEITLESVPGFDRPMSANPNDEIVGQDELTGRPIYETALGQRYTLSLNPDQRTFRTRFEEDILPGMQGYLENPTLPTVSQIGDFAVDTVKGAYEGLEGAVQGRGTLGDVTGLAVGSGAGSVFGEVPEGAIRIFGGFNAARDPGIDASGRQLPRSVGAENLPRFEIDDSVAKYNPQNLVEKDFSGRRLDTIDWDMVNAYPGRFLPTLDQVIDHPELFRQYPELAKVNIVIDTSLTQKVNGYYHPDKNLIAVSRYAADDPDLFAETLLHEVQHDVQKREGFDVGTSPESDIVGIRQASQIAQNPEAEEDIRYLGYYNKSGEVEPRNVGDRKYLTLEERFETPPTRTESVDRGRQWIVDESGNIKDAVDLFGTGEENRGGFLRRLGNLLRGRRGSQYNSGGVVSMEEQMSLFEMGGLADDGAMRDPVSGNEVPPGSLANEVRDDVPAMLSEGEYIVPADVVRYYGVRFFEDLRSQAKAGLMDMERNGRIGGEPVPGPEGELSPEEMAMLAEITGMYAGGDVRRPQKDTMSIEEVLSSNESIYDIINSPTTVYLGDGSIATSPEMKRDMFRRIGLIQIADASGMYGGGMVRKGYQTGGTVTQEDFMNQAQQAENYRLPSSVFAPSAPTTQPTAPFTPVTLYGPTGDTMLATTQEQYNSLIAQGYTTQPRVTQPVAPTGGGGDGGGGGSDDLEAAGGGFRLSDENFESLRNNPLAFGTEALGAELPLGASTRQVAGALSMVAGPVGMIAGGLGGAAFELDNIAKARAALAVARSQGLEGTAEYTALETRLRTAEENLTGPARLLEKLGLGSGNSYINQYEEFTSTAPAAPAAGRTSTGGGGATTTLTPAPVRDSVTFVSEGPARGTVAGPGQAARPGGNRPAPEPRDSTNAGAGRGGDPRDFGFDRTEASKTSSQKEAERAAERLGTEVATKGRATGGLVARPSRKNLLQRKNNLLNY